MILESKFIEDTDEKYSIRNDGVVIRHYRYDKWGNKLTKDYVLTNHIRIDKRKQSKSPVIVVTFNKQQFILKSLIAKYFNLALPQNTKVYEIKHKDNDFTKCGIDNLYYVNHKTRKELAIAAKNKAIINVTRWYVASKLCIPVDILSDELFESYKATLLVKRLIATKLNGKPQHI